MQPSASWLPTHSFQAEKGNAHLTKTVKTVSIKKSRKKESTKHTLSFCSLPCNRTNSFLCRTSCEDSVDDLQLRHSHSHTPPLYTALAPGLISLPPLFQHQQASYCSSNCSAMPKLTGLSHFTQDLIGWGAAQGLSLPCIEMLRIISWRLVSSLPAMCSHLTPW